MEEERRGTDNSINREIHLNKTIKRDNYMNENKNKTTRSYSEI